MLPPQQVVRPPSCYYLFYEIKNYETEMPSNGLMSVRNFVKISHMFLKLKRAAGRQGEDVVTSQVCLISL